MEISAQQLSELLNGVIEGDQSVKVSGPSKIEEGIEGTISFLGHPKYEDYAYSTQCSILLVSNDFKAQKPILPTLIRVENVYKSVAVLFEKFGETTTKKMEISSLAQISDSSCLGENVGVEAFTVVSDNVSIGRNSEIHGQVFIGKNVKIGENVVLFPGVKIYHDCVIGDNCILHANVVIGSDGFGFAPQEDGTFLKIPQLGNVILENDVEIGAQTVVDRATMGSTILRKGVKLDNLIQIAHNVEIGQNTVIASQTGIAGTTKIGKNCMIGGQVGFAGHLKIGDNVRIQAQSGISRNIEDNEVLFGSPAIGYTDFIKSYAVFKKLPNMYRQFGQMSKAIDNLKNVDKE